MSDFEDKLNSILNDPAQMDKIAGLAKTLMGGDGAEKAPPVSSEKSGDNNVLGSIMGGIDGETMGRIAKVFSAVNSEDDNQTALLKAMEPYLSEKRRNKMDKAIKIARIAKVARLALGEMGDDGSV